MCKRYRVAVYLRLSKEDGEAAEESNSITNQRLMLKKYARENFENYELKEFVDDGASGTNFLRPGVTAMLDQVRNGEIDCVLVKDFSRFSRDYIELGSYLDQIFPFLGVRFISLNDNYDSEKQKGNTAGLDVSFKGLLYDLYSKDLSVKIKSSLYTRRKQGEYSCGNAPFGYVKDKKDRHKLYVMQDEAEVVKRIFSLALEGKTSAEIARIYNSEKVPTPIEYKIKKGQASRNPLGNKFQWESAAICSILKNPTYVGDMVYGKYEKDGVGGKKHLKPREEWKIYKNSHQEIISREDFEKVQLLRKKTGYRQKKGQKSRHPLQGKVFCGGCLKAMALRKSGRNPYFSCNHRYVYASAQNCVRNVNLMFLEQLILCEFDSKVMGRESLGKIKPEKAVEACKKTDGAEFTEELAVAFVQKVIVYDEEHIEIEWKDGSA